MRRFSGNKLVVATHNAGKLAEISALLRPYAVQVLSAKELNLPEPAETETTFVGNARIKAHAGAQATGLPTLADDSGICVDVLDGAPGVYTADWAETPNGRDFPMAMRRTWDAIQAKGGAAPYRAQFRSTLVLAWPDGEDALFDGVLRGQVVWPMRGDNGHGYDPIFQPDGHNVTVAEMADDLKNTISHRAEAFRKMIAGCFS